MMMQKMKNRAIMMKMVNGYTTAEADAVVKEKAKAVVAKAK